METLKKKVLEELLQIDCHNIAIKLGFITESSREISAELIANVIRCLDHETSMIKDPDINYIITVFALIWEYVDHSKYNLQKIAVKFLSRIGYSTSAIITDNNFDKENCKFSSLESPIDELLTSLNQEKYDVSIGKRKFILTKFQMDIWNSMDNDKLIGISAPTSAGKSFVILLKLLKKLKSDNFDIIYIVPTLSLVNQVISDFNEYIKELEIENYKINSTYEESCNNSNNIFVLTQEKTINIFSDENNKFQKNTVLVVDEIQNIERIKDDNDERSKILYDTLNELRNKQNIKQVILSGPRINKIDETATALFGHKAKRISSYDSPVLNLTYSISKIENVYKFKQYCALHNIPVVINITNTSIIKGYGQRLYNDKFLEYLNTMLSNLSKNQNIIFAPNASTARKIACSINNKNKINDNIKDLINYYKKTVNEEYSLCKTLENGVTYHHGKLPHHVRRTLEKAMQENWITDIICTTTLLQGINLPAQNIIIRNPNLYIKKDKDKNKNVELTNYEMANLRGRAGRLLKDFIGRTFVLDETSFIVTDGYEKTNLFDNTTKDLPNDYSERYEKYKNEIVDTLLNEDINSEQEEDDNKKEIRYKDLKTYIRQNILKNGDVAKQKMEQVGINLTKEQIAAIKLKLEKLTIPKELCYKNRYWDPFTLDYIYRNYTDKVPSFPLERGAKTKFNNMLKFLRDNTRTKSMYNRYIPKKYREGKARKFMSDLCYQWATGTPLSDILTSNLKNVQKPEDTIEEIIEILQNIASYKVPLLLKPIFDIKNPDSTFLNCMQSGACNDILKKLIELGIPRECALSLYDAIFKEKKLSDDTIEDEIRKLLRDNYLKLPYWMQVQLQFLI